MATLDELAARLELLEQRVADLEHRTPMTLVDRRRAYRDRDRPPTPKDPAP